MEMFGIRDISVQQRPLRAREIAAIVQHIIPGLRSFDADLHYVEHTARNGLMGINVAHVAEKPCTSDVAIWPQGGSLFAPEVPYTDLTIWVLCWDHTQGDGVALMENKTAALADQFVVLWQSAFETVVDSGLLPPYHTPDTGMPIPNEHSRYLST